MGKKLRASLMIGSALPLVMRAPVVPTLDRLTLVWIDGDTYTCAEGVHRVRVPFCFEGLPADRPVTITGMMIEPCGDGTAIVQRLTPADRRALP